MGDDMEHYLSGYYQFASGAGMMGAVVCAMFFFRFWWKTTQRIFLIFGLAFLTLGIERIVLANYDSARENQPLVYLIRLSAFILILWGIWDKNRKGVENETRT